MQVSRGVGWRLANYGRSASCKDCTVKVSPQNRCIDRNDIGNEDLAPKLLLSSPSTIIRLIDAHELNVHKLYELLYDIGTKETLSLLTTSTLCDEQKTWTDSGRFQLAEFDDHWITTTVTLFSEV